MTYSKEMETNMKYLIPFTLHNKQNNITVEYDENPNAYESGFHILKLPFDVNECIGYPMVHAYFENLSLKGYERYLGWIQIIKREEYDSISEITPCNIEYDLDVPENIREHKLPYFAFGYPAELFDAPCNNLNGCEKLIWRAYTYLVDIPSKMNDYQTKYLAGFSWGYTENSNKKVSILEFEMLSEDDWKKHKKYTEFNA